MGRGGAWSATCYIAWVRLSVTYTLNVQNANVFTALSTQTKASDVSTHGVTRARHGVTGVQRLECKVELSGSLELGEVGEHVLGVGERVADGFLQQQRSPMHQSETHHVFKLSFAELST